MARITGDILSVISGPTQQSGVNDGDTGPQDWGVIGEDPRPLESGVDYLLLYSAQAGGNTDNFGAAPSETRIRLKVNIGSTQSDADDVGDVQQLRSPLEGTGEPGNQFNGVRLQGYTVVTGDGVDKLSLVAAAQNGDGVNNFWFGGVGTAYAIPLTGFVEETDYWKNVTNDETVQLTNAPTGSFSDVVSDTFTLPETGDYLVLMSVDADPDSTSSAEACRVRFEVDSADVAGTDAGGGEGYQLEANVDLTGAPRRFHSFACARLLNLAAGSHTFRIRGRSRSAAVTDYQRGRIVVLRSSTMGPFASNLKSAQDTGTGTAYAQGGLPALTVTPAAVGGQNLLIGSVSTMTNGAGQPNYRLRNAAAETSLAEDTGTMMVDAGYDSSSDLMPHTLLGLQISSAESEWRIERRIRNGVGTIRSMVAGDGSTNGLSELISWDLAPSPDEIARIQIGESKQTDVLAKYLPTGRAWAAKLREGTVTRGLLQGLATELLRSTDLVEEFRNQVIPDQTILFLDEWESALEIPDGCFTGVGTNAERRRDILAKLVSLGVQTADDFEALANLFGLGVIVTGGSLHGTFPFVFPMILFPDERTARHTIVVDVTSNPVASVFPFTFPLTFGDDLTTLVECLFRRLKPANCDLLFLNL